jgi:hypothetical protein
MLNLRRTSSTPFALLWAAAFVMTACSVNVRKGENGEEKKVDIETPIGGIHVDKEADVRDTGLAVYPGARMKEKSGNDENRANVNISAGRFGLKVIAISYESDDPPEKLIAYYKDQLKRYGHVLECHTSGHPHVQAEGGTHSKELKCDGDNSGKRIELKVGSEDNQRVVSIEPQGKGSEFALVLVQTRGRGTI